MPVELRFEFPVEPTPGPVELLFGRTPGGSSPITIEATLAATLPPASLSLTLAARIVPVRLGAAEAVLPPAALSLGLSAEGVQDLDLPSDVGPTLAAPQSQGLPTAGALAIAQQSMLATRHALEAAQQQAAPLACPLGFAQQQMRAARRPLAQLHAHGERLVAGVAAAYAEQLRTRRPLAARHAHGRPLSAGTRPRHAEQIRTRRALATRAVQAVATAAGLTAGHHHGLPAGARLAVRQQQAMPLPVGFWQGSLPGGGDGAGALPYSSPVQLVFWRLDDGTTRLVFGPRPAAGQQPIIIPVREIYLVINSFSLVRADTGQPLEVDGFSASLSFDGWCWSWSAALPGALLPLVRAIAPGEMIELVATLNGIPLRLAVERIGRDRRFASSMLRISGRGRAAWLDAPRSPVQSFYNNQLRTAQQLLEDALTVNGVPVGWTVDWQIDDWTVPAGAWSHTGSYKDAAVRIAEAGGGYVQAHDTAQTLAVKSLYPLAPWDWAAATPDLELPEAVCEIEGIEWLEKPGYNAVYVVGGAGGRRDRIKRVGSDAATVAPTIVDPLAADPIMTRNRGLAVLADTGRQAHISVRLPVLPETGIVRPGTLVRYTESGNIHIGLTRAVSVERTWPQIWQTVRIETHVAEPV